MDKESQDFDSETEAQEDLEELLNQTDAFSYAAARAEAFVTNAKQSLSLLSQSEARTALCELADFAIIRNN